jgi:hypothetical protein
MADGRINNGGKRPGQGRPSKAETENLVENLHKYIDREEAIVVLKRMIMDDKNFKALALYLAYVYGKPKEVKDITINQEQPLFLLDEITNEII